jgi:hypothetical protein
MNGESWFCEACGTLLQHGERRMCTDCQPAGLIFMDLRNPTKPDDLINIPEYDDGINACMGGMGQNANPMPPDTEAFKAWDLGWNDANDQMPK